MSSPTTAPGCKTHLHKAEQLLAEETKLARYEYEDAHEQTRQAEQEENEARGKFLALKSTVTLLQHTLSKDDKGRD